MANEVDIWINAARIVTAEHHGTHKSNVAETYGKQRPGKFNISVLQTLSGFSCPKKIFIKSTALAAYFLSYECCLRYRSDLTTLHHMVT